MKLVHQPGSNPIAARDLPVTVGALSEFSEDPVGCLLALQRRHGELAALQEGDSRIVFVFGPAWNQQVLSDGETSPFGLRAVVVMPEHTYLRENVAPLAEGPFRAQLQKARSRGVRTLEHAASLPDDAFSDLAHVTAEGRDLLSRTVAPELRALLETP